MALILDAASSLFAEKGVEGATMTEIAARSGTAIGSLYRFFPTRESIAITLLERFIEDRLDLLDRLYEELGPGALDDAAERLMNAWLEKREERDVTTMLMASRPDAEHYTAQWRSQFLQRVVRILERVTPDKSETAPARGVVMLHVLKLAPQLVTGPLGGEIEKELRQVVLRLLKGS
ncbi:TetR/AcrR family transcriptional regulator [Asaia krungthepensis]|uniref:TetR/AcrR family transcriptional regulator n=1 Tax=Asaia krungthepensis TaxID=220990 RepID=UPI00222E763B|nr:TetR/AcrR family transcriptional regulator [Asaia krungthepensis]